MKNGDFVIYVMTEEESKANNYQKYAPAIVVAIFRNEYQGSNDLETTGLNLKVFTDGDSDFVRRSCKNGTEGGCWNLMMPF